MPHALPNRRASCKEKADVTKSVRFRVFADEVSVDGPFLGRRCCRCRCCFFDGPLSGRLSRRCMKVVIFHIRLNSSDQSRRKGESPRGGNRLFRLT